MYFFYVPGISGNLGIGSPHSEPFLGTVMGVALLWFGCAVFGICPFGSGGHYLVFPVFLCAFVVRVHFFVFGVCVFFH